MEVRPSFARNGEHQLSSQFSPTDFWPGPQEAASCFTPGKPTALYRRLLTQSGAYVASQDLPSRSWNGCLSACTHRPSRFTCVALSSYYESPGNCEDCPVFQVDFHRGGQST